MEDLSGDGQQQAGQNPLLPNGNIIYRSEAMALLVESVKKVAKTDANVLITGETGTGKELIARAIHSNSPRKHRPFVTVNCSAIPENLIESEFFGTVKGAFTGAIERPGRFEQANSGTIFLDEIGELSKNIQVKLLRVLQEKKFERVGSLSTVEVDVRIVTGTNRILQNEIKQGNFREDLFYRLNVFPIHIVPLRERKEDIPILTEYFLEKFSSKKGVPVVSIEGNAIDVLRQYPWPGNVRELENLIARMIISSDSSIITTDDLPLQYLPAKQPETLEMRLLAEEIQKYKALCNSILNEEIRTAWELKIVAEQLGIWQKRRGVAGLGRILVKVFERHKKFFQGIKKEGMAVIFDFLCLNSSFKKEQSARVDRLLRSW